MFACLSRGKFSALSFEILREREKIVGLYDDFAMTDGSEE